MNTGQPYTIPQRNLLLLATVLVVIGSFVPWEIEGDFISTWRYGILVLLLGVAILGLVFRSEGFVKNPTKWGLTSSIALFIISVYHIVDWLIRRIAANGVIGAPAIRFGLILVGIGSGLILATTFLMNSKASANHVQK